MKEDKPLIAVKVEKGRLVPATEFDQELLANWGEGTVLNIEATRTVVPPLERKYFAMLTKLLVEANTPWTNREQAHNAIKKATGFCNYNRAWKPLARSISSFDSTELSEFFELFCGIVSQKYGIDPETLGREAANSEYESPGVHPADAFAGDGPGAGLIPASAGVAESPSEIIEPMEGGVPKGGDGDETTPRAPLSPGGLTQQDLDWLRQTARMLVAAVGNDPDILNRQRNAIKLHHTHPDISSAARDIGAAIYRHCLSVCKGTEPLDLGWVAANAGCSPDDLKPEAR